MEDIFTGASIPYGGTPRGFWNDPVPPDPTQNAEGRIRQVVSHARTSRPNFRRRFGRASYGPVNPRRHDADSRDAGLYTAYTRILCRSAGIPWGRDRCVVQHREI